MTTDANLSGKIDSIVNLARHWKETMPAKPRKEESTEGEWREWEGLKFALDSFMSFASDYKIILIEAPLPNQKFILNKGAEKILQGFSVLSRACEQRRGRTTRDDSPAKYLAQAEDALDIYCSRWVANNFGDIYLRLVTPVVYFEKLYGISRSLYAPQIPIISIPFTSYDRANQWQALAHEMGHHIYWNAIDDLAELDKFHKALAASIKKGVEGSANLITETAQVVWDNWSEEIFADICGTLLAGPEYVISCQNTTAEQAKTVHDLALDDDEHPVPFLRPIIALQVLRELNNDSSDSDIANKINDIELRWTKYSSNAEVEPIKNIHYKPGNDEEPLKLSDFLSQIIPVIRAVMFSTIWPENKKLLDLIQPFENILYKNINFPLEKLGEIPSPRLGKTGSKPSIRVVSSSQPIFPPADANIPDSMKKLWEYIKGNELFPGQPGNNENAEAQWETLLDLSLEETHTHTDPHTQCKTHFLVSKHYHDAVGQKWRC